MVEPQHAGDILVELIPFIEIFRVPRGKFNDRDFFFFAPPADECVFLSLPILELDSVIDSIYGLEIPTYRFHDEKESGSAFLCM